MTASIERAGMVNGFKGTLRRAGRAARGPLARLSGHVLITTADVASHADGRPGGPGLLAIPGGAMAERLTSPERPTEDPEPSV